jgi:hypothetical protein
MIQNYRTSTVYLLWVSFWKALSFWKLPIGIVILQSLKSIEINEKKR